MKLIKKLSVFTILAVLFLAVASCGINEKYADKINKAAADKEYITYEEVVKKLGEDNIVDWTGSADLGFVDVKPSGVVYAIKGCDSWDDVEEKLEAGKTVKGIVITFLNGNATNAVYKEFTNADKK